MLFVSLAQETPDKAEYEQQGLFVDAVNHEIQEEYEKAEKIYRKLHKQMPDNAAVSYKLAGVLEKVKQYKEAEKFAKKAIDADNGNPYYYEQLARIYEKEENYKEQASLYEEMLDNVKEKRKENYYNLASAYIKQEEYKKAIKIYDRVEKDFGFSQEASQHKQQLYFRLGKTDDAIKESRRLIEAFPEEPVHYVALAEIYLNNKDLPNAVKSLQEALEMSPDNAQARLVLSELYKMEGKTDEALEQIEVAFQNPDLSLDNKIRVVVSYLGSLGNEKDRADALRLAKMMVTAHPQEPQALAIYGDLLNMTGQQQAARDSYIQSARLGSASFNVWLQVIEIDMALQQNDSLVTHASEAAELYPNQAAIWLYKGTGHALEKEYKKAIEAFKMGKNLSLNDDGTYIQFQLNLGDAYNGAKQYEESDKAFEAVLRRDPNNVYALNNYAYYLAERKAKLPRAKELAEKLLAAQPEEASYIDTYGWILYAAKEYDKALEQLEKAAKLSQDGTILEHYGDALYKNGKKQQALEQWKKAKKAGGQLSDDIDRKVKEGKLL